MLVFWLFVIAGLIISFVSGCYFVFDLYVRITFSKVKILSSSLSSQPFRATTKNNSPIWYKLSGEIKYTVEGEPYKTGNLSLYSMIISRNTYAIERIKDKILKRGYIFVSKKNPKLAYIEPSSWREAVPMLSFILGVVVLILSFLGIR
jgi:hypothetical protein